MPRRTVMGPGLGLFLNVPPSEVPSKALTDCLNVRIRKAKIVRDNMGWTPFPNSSDALNLGGKAVTLIDTFTLRNGTTRTVFGNTTDLFQYDESSKTLEYITPAYTEGTVDVSGSSASVMGNATLWAANVKPGDQISFGSSTEASIGATWYEVATVGSDTSLTLTTPFAGSSGSGVAYTIRRVFTGDADDVFFTEMFYGGENFGAGSGEDRWYATNGVDPVVAWDGVLSHAYLPDLGDISTCKYLRRQNSQMIYVAPTANGAFLKYSIRTSRLSDPEDVVNDEAQEFIVHDGNDELQCAMRLGDLLVIYGESSVTLAQFVGPPIYYTFRTVVDGEGPRSPRGVAAFPEFHHFIGSDGLYIFDGSRAQAVNQHVWRDVVRRLVPSRMKQLHTWIDAEQAELHWVVPLTGDADPVDGHPEHAYTQHYLETVDTQRYGDVYTYRDLPATVFGSYARAGGLNFDDLPEPWESYNFAWNDKFFFAGFPQTLFGTAEGDIMMLGESATQDGEVPTSFVRFARTPMGDVETNAVCRRIYPLMQQMPGSTFAVDVLLHTTDTLDGVAELAFEGTFNLAMNTSRRFVSPRKDGRFADITIGTSTGTDYWALNGYVLDSIRAGDR